MKVLWTTESVAPHDKFGYWREVLCEAFVALLPQPREKDVPFHGVVNSRPLGATAQTSIASTPQSNDRRWDEIRRNPVDYCFANFQQEGTCVVRQDGRETVAGPDSFYVVDTTRPYFLEYTQNWRVLSFRIPRSQLERRLGSTRGVTAVRVDGKSGLGLVATQFAGSLQTLDEDASATESERLATALNELLAAAFASSHSPGDSDPQSLQHSARLAIERFIEGHLSDPALGPDMVAARFNMSRRYLYSLFEAQPQSIGAVIRSRRLEQCARDLTSNRRQSILEVALRWGFNDPSQFSRAFKQHFGVTPKTFIGAAPIDQADLLSVDEPSARR